MDLEIIDNPVLADLTGFGPFDRVNFLRVSNNQSLVNLKGLEAITRVGAELLVSEHPRLESLQGLENVEQVGLNLRILENAILGNLQGLEGINRIARNLVIFDNPSLPSELARSLAERVAADGGIGGKVDIAGNRQ